MTDIWRDAPNFQKHCQTRLAEAETTHRALADHNGADLLSQYNEVLRHLDTLGAQSGLMANVHPDAMLREAAESCERAVQKQAADLTLDRPLFERLSAIDPSRLDPQAQRFREKSLRDFRRSGVDKDEATRSRLKQIHEAMVSIGQDFDRNIRDDRRTLAVDPETLSGLPEDFLKAHPINPQGQIILTTDYPDFFAIETYAESEDLRRRLTLEFLNRGYPSNLATLAKLLGLRHEYATILGYKSWADYQAKDKMVRSAKVIEQFIDQVAESARPRMKTDLALLLARKRKDRPGAQAIENWDRFYYVDRVRAEAYGADAKSLRPYFEYGQVLKGMLAIYAELFQLRFQQRTDVIAWHGDVETYDVFSDQERVGRFYLDMHPRDGKYGHAAMFNLVTGLSGGQLPEATLVCNFPHPKAAVPALMLHSDVITLFHEFGHLIHHLLARGSPWVSLAGISTEADFVEAPSQLLEEWAWDADVLQRFARHIENGQPIPADLVKKMRAADEFGKGIQVMRQVFYSALSYRLHAEDPHRIDLDAFTRKIQARYSPYPYAEGTHEYASFGHLEGYSSLYYTYQWSLALAKDIFTRFSQTGLLNSATAAEYRKKILEPGGTRDADDLVNDFLGRQHNLEAYRRWLEAE